MTEADCEVVKARWIFPVSQPPINGGWLRLAQGKIIEIGHRDVPAGARDLGDVAILPGLVNAHTHLEFSDFREPIGEPGIGLPEWIGRVVVARKDNSSESKAAAMRAGLQEITQGGTRLLGEISTPPEVAASDARLDVFPFAEVLGLSSERGDERWEAARQTLASNPIAGISPHAPYSTPPDLVRRCVSLAHSLNRSVAMHVAESPAERELLRYGSGPFADSLRAMGVWNERLFPWSKTPFRDLLGWLSEAPRALVVHGNDLQADEIEQLSRNPQMSVVYCPRTHHFFQYDSHPVDQLLRAGVKVALGTDSRASNPDLDVWHEVQFLLRHRPDLDPAAIIKMVTLDGAKAMGRFDLGALEVGGDAKLSIVPTAASNLEKCYEDFEQAECRSL